MIMMHDDEYAECGDRRLRRRSARVQTEQIQGTAAAFAAGGWDVPRLLHAMRRADDVLFDTVSQIRMPCWSTGRVATLVRSGALGVTTHNH
jgi:hypothetical protein